MCTFCFPEVLGDAPIRKTHLLMQSRMLSNSGRKETRVGEYMQTTSTLAHGGSNRGWLQLSVSYHTRLMHRKFFSTIHANVVISMKALCAARQDFWMLVQRVLYEGQVHSNQYQYINNYYQMKYDINQFMNI